MEKRINRIHEKCNGQVIKIKDNLYYCPHCRYDVPIWEVLVRTFTWEKERTRFRD